MYLFKKAVVYAPQKIGVRDVLVLNDRILAVEENLVVSLPGLEVVDAEGLIMTPGLIDQHVHLLGGGGEGGPVSRVPEIPFSRLAACGTTTAVGVLGTDSVTRSVQALLAKVRAVKQEGLSAWMYTSNYALPPTLLSRSVRDDLFLVPEVVGVKIAFHDHRSSFPTVDELLRILSDVRVGGMIAGKPGVLHIHMGDLPGSYDAFKEIIARGVPAKHLRPTHCARDKALFEDMLDFARSGGVVDVTSGGGCAPLPEIMDQLVREKAVLENVTFSTDGGGSIPRFDANGNMVGLGTGSPAANLDMLRDLTTNHGFALETLLPMVTANVADNLGLVGKGRIGAGFDGDLCCFDKDMQLRHVIAKGAFLMRDGVIVKKGAFEE